ncbi:MAG TPA: chemotaxis response regulator protein-glutamate methylesterase [Verrucomicrobiae bacterium]|nr:chemotaxis response regulator protein-glutamate methylesterase [Verrucomicrobiae bacterium]
MALGAANEPAIRVLVADGSPFMRVALTRMIQSHPRLRVVAEVANAREVLAQIARFDPDVITLDIEMHNMDGLEILRRIMEDHPKPVIVVSSVTREGAEETLEALALGAFDCIPKLVSSDSFNILSIRDQLLEKIFAASAAPPPLPPRLHERMPEPPPDSRLPAALDFPPAVIAIGASTGGPKAIQEIIPRLPADFPAGIVIVQHMPPGFTSPFARRLGDLSRIAVREAAHGDHIRPGLALVAPALSHITLSSCSPSGFCVHLSKTPAGTLHTPSVDVMMLSAAEVCGSHVMGVIMTGMGSDGARGMKAIHDSGGYTIGQDESSCSVYGMPRACAELGILDRVVPLSRLSEEILWAARSPAASWKPSI